MSESIYIFGDNLQELENDWLENDLVPLYGSVKNDIMVREWDEFRNPVVEFKNEGLYEDFKLLVHSRRVTGTFYRVVEEDEHFEHLRTGDKIDYRSCLTNWISNF